MRSIRQISKIVLWGCVATLWTGIALSQQESKSTPATVDNGPGAPVQSTVNSPAPEKDATEETKAGSEPTENAAQSSPTIQRQGEEEPTCGPRCQESRQNERDDLVAQQFMARATEEIVNVSWWQLGLTSLGTGLLLFTLKLTQDSNKTAQAATAAAIESNKIARETSKKELRAYVLLDKIEVKNFAANNVPSLEITVKNFGVSPATAFRHWPVVGYQPYPLPNNFPGFDESMPSSNAIIAPGQDVEGKATFSRTLTDAEVQAVSLGKNAFYAFGLIKYIDCFGNDRETRYCSFIGGPVGKKDFMAAYESGNSYT